MIRKPRHHLTKVLAGTKLQGGESDAGPLADSGHHRALAILIRRTSQRQAPSISWREGTNCSSNAGNKAGRSGTMNNVRSNKTKKHPYPRCELGHRWPLPAQWRYSSLRPQGPPGWPWYNAPASSPHGWRRNNAGELRLPVGELTELSPIIQGRWRRARPLSGRCHGMSSISDHHERGAGSSPASHIGSTQAGPMNSRISQMHLPLIT
jgi:hypothetical protein